MTTTTTRPACVVSGLPDVGIYVACLASYNAGHLHGAWLDLEGDVDEDDIREGIAWVLATSPAPDAEEYAVHDSSGLPGFLANTEWPDLEQLVSFADGLADLPNPDEQEAYRLECENQGQVIDTDAFRETYRGCWPDGSTYAMELASETEAMPEQVSWPMTCIDWDNAWRELTYDGYREEPCSSGGVHIFRSC